MELEAIETIYNGYKFRSRLEARWAYFFDMIRVDYEYEPEGIKIGNEYYLPDFYLPEFNVYFEVKRVGLEKQEREDAIRKISYGTHNHPEYAGVICFGDPEENDLTLYCYEYTDSSGGNASFQVEFGVSDDSCLVTLIRMFDSRDREILADASGCKVVRSESYKDATVSEHIRNARLKARQAQFDHGRTPENPRKSQQERVKQCKRR